MGKYYKAEDMENLIINIAPDGEVFELGMSALQSLPTIEVMEYPQVEGITPTLVTTEVSEDCISREWLLNGLSKMADDWVINNAVQHGVYEAHDFVKTAPSVVPSREEGEWELSSDNDGEYGICSICGNDADFTHYGKPYHYCPNCGAKMKGA